MIVMWIENVNVYGEMEPSKLPLKWSVCHWRR